MTDEQRTRLGRLGRLALIPGSSDAYFVRDVGRLPADCGLSDREAARVEWLWHYYRRQLRRTARSDEGGPR